MLNSLRGRLLLSYIAVISATLVVIAAGLFGFATVSSIRFVPDLQRLAAISRSNQNDLLRLWDAGASGDELQALLLDTAEQTDVRILVVDTTAQEIIFDTTLDDDWVGDHLGDVERPTRLALPNAGRDSIFGRFQPPNGSRWLVYADPNPAFGRALIFYSQPETRPVDFFSAFFLRPLAFAGVLALLLSILMAALITRSVARPLQETAAAAAQIAQGNYDQRVPPEGPDEVRRVATSFNSMAAQVKATQQAQQDFVANVSHDLKTPITVISGWSQALLDGAADSPEEQQRAAETIYAESDRMARMVNDLLDLARLETGQLQLIKEPVDLNHIMAEVHNNFQPRAREGDIELALDLSPTPPVMGDHDRLMQIFGNLTSNALTYTPQGGRVVLGTLHEGDWVEVVIADSGPGIPAEEQERIFERFYRVERSRSRDSRGGGTGIGLAIVGELVQAHGGQVSVISDDGQGAVFTVRLPAVG